jgi:tRNA G18 (ribose-2'-O)-methylase SpoU
MIRKLSVTELDRLTPEEYREARKTPLVVVLDNVRSMHNIGSVFRTCDAFRAEAVYLCGISSTPPHAEIHKSALGAEDTVSWKYYADTLDAVAGLRSEGYRVYAVELAEGSIKLPELSIPVDEKVAVVLGHEVKGVQQSVIDACDACIEIPQLGTKHSLNVSVTGGIIIWEIFKQLRDGLER